MSGKKVNKREIVIASLALVLATSLLFLSVPRLLASASVVQAAPSISVLRRGAEVNYKALSKAEALLHKAISWDGDNPDYFLDLAFVHRRMADAKFSDNRDGQRFLQLALQNFATALRLAPSNARAWAHLAEAHYAFSGMTSEVSRALRISFLTGHIEPNLLAIRLKLGLQNWQALPSDVKWFVKLQARQMWHIYSMRDDLVRIYLQFGLKERLVIFDQVPPKKQEQKEFASRLRALGSSS